MGTATAHRLWNLSGTCTVLVEVSNSRKHPAKEASRQFALLDGVACSYGSDEQLCVQLWAALRTVGKEAHERVPDSDRVRRVRRLEQLAQRRGFQLGVVRTQLQLRELEIRTTGEEIV